MVRQPDGIPPRSARGAIVTSPPCNRYRPVAPWKLPASNVARPPTDARTTTSDRTWRVPDGPLQEQPARPGVQPLRGARPRGGPGQRAPTPTSTSTPPRRCSTRSRASRRTSSPTSFADADRNPPVYDPDSHTVTMPESFKKSYRAYIDAGWGNLDVPAELGGTVVPAVAASWAVQRDGARRQPGDPHVRGVLLLRQLLCTSSAPTSRRSSPS